MKKIYEFVCVNCPFHFYLKEHWISTPRPTCPQCGERKSVVELAKKAFFVASEDQVKIQSVELKVNNYLDRERIVLGLIHSGFTVGVEERKSGLTQTDYYINVSKEGFSFEGKSKETGGTK